jgi:hypothetical protein
MRSKEVENSIKELTEITDLVKEEIKNNDENTTAILDITDLKNLDTLLNYISELENKLKQAKDYINEEMYVDYNVTISSEEDFYNDLPCSLNLHNEDLRKLLDMLEN